MILRIIKYHLKYGILWWVDKYFIFGMELEYHTLHIRIYTPNPINLYWDIDLCNRDCYIDMSILYAYDQYSVSKIVLELADPDMFKKMELAIDNNILKNIANHPPIWLKGSTQMLTNKELNDL